MAKGGKFGQTLVWILMAMLILGLGGFGISNFGGSVRSIGTVGDQSIGTNDYARALQQDLNALSAQVGRNIPYAEAAGFGIDRTVRQRLVTTAALDDLADRIGLSVGDARLATEIRTMRDFGGVSGQFDRDAYRFMLQQNGMTEAQFETRVRSDIARGMIQAAISTGTVGPDVLATAYHEYLAERRSFSLLRLTADDLPTPLPEAAEGDLRAYYDANPETYTRPEARRIAYAVLLPESLIGEVAVDEVKLREAYDARISDFVQPERRLIERLVFNTDAEAEAARNRIDSGATTFEALVAERGLTLSDVDQGDLSVADLGAAGEAVFALTDPGVVGPLPSSLGPALFRMNGVLAAQEITFDEAREELMSEFATDAARRIIADKVDDIDDLLAGGATLEDLAKDAGMDIGTIDMLPGLAEGLAAYPAFRERAAQVTDRDFPEVFQLSDGGIAAIRLDAIVPPALRPYEDVAEQVADDWARAQLTTALTAQLAAAEEGVKVGASLGAYGIVSVVMDAARDGTIDAAPRDLLATVFAMNEGEVRSVTAGDYIGLIRLDAITAADPQEPEAQAIKAAITNQTGQQIAQDAFALFAASVEQSVKIQLDEAAINAVHSQMQ
ncbi:MAG: SurA N-terminal domain-containing protein [Gemmobacter sp.]|nr:SurA N-terminal domain-containing protein [Gemmobacter sp.]